MALEVWMPLNGNLNNYGLDDPTINSSATFSTDYSGRIGNYAKSGAITVTSGKLRTEKSWTVAFWGKVNSSLITSNWTAIGYIGDGNSNVRIEVCPSTYSSGRYCYSIHNNSANAIFTGSIAGPEGGYYDQWAHFCLTCDGTTITKYMNGINVGTIAYSGSGRITGVVALSNCDKIYRCDLRIYSHCLSPKEVLELSKCCIMHYDFNDTFGESTTNLDPCKDSVSSGTLVNLGNSNAVASYTKVNEHGCDCIKVTINTGTISSWTGVYLHCNPISLGAAVGDTVTRSCYMYIPSGQTLPGYFREVIEGTPTNQSFVQYDHTKPDTWQRVSSTGTLIDTTKSNFLHYFMAMSSGSVNNFVFYIRDFQMEIKDHPTAYTPSARVGQFFDGSGFGNHSTNSQNVSIIRSPKKLGSKVAKFSGNSFIALPQTLKVKEALTASFMGYCENWANFGRVFSCTEGGGWNFEILSNAMSFNIYISSIGYINCIGPATSSISAGWHLFTGTCDTRTGTVKLYMDGVLQKTTSFTAGNLIGYNSSNTIFLGAEASSSATTPIGPYFNGYLADARIYATALSDDDVLKLYQSMANIDNNYNLSCFEFIEDENRTTFASLTTDNPANPDSIGTFTARSLEEIPNSYEVLDIRPNRLSIRTNSGGTFSTSLDGIISLHGKIWVQSDYIEIDPDKYTFSYNFTLKNPNTNLVYVGFEKYDENKTSTSNNSCSYVYWQSSVVSDYKTFTGTVNLAADSNGAKTKYIKLRILNNWSTLSTETPATISHLSLKATAKNPGFRTYDDGALTASSFIER